VLKIADFGFAKIFLSEDHMNKSCVGTPYYMSPQQLKRERYTSKCDIWAIGLIYYEVFLHVMPAAVW
jgi:serine/threonine protein kinase